MAKNPTPTNDPAALAFSAVEDALKESVFNMDNAAQQAPERKPADIGRSERLRAADKIAQRAGAVANASTIAEALIPSAALFIFPMRSPLNSLPEQNRSQGRTGPPHRSAPNFDDSLGENL